MNQDELKKIIDKYVQCYNSFDIDGMMSLMHRNVYFQNISEGKVTMSTQGISELRHIAEQSKSIFKTHCQTITSYDIKPPSEASIELEYQGEFAFDIPNGPQAGDKIHLKGKSEFVFKDGLIIQLKDIS
jgi:hypothetical protein